MSKKNEALARQRLHEKRMMNCGQECEIIEYHSARNITVRFTDGTTISNREYKDFELGTIKHPATQTTTKRDERIGARKKMNSGLFAVIKNYRGTKDVDVEFEIDGAITYHKSWYDFQRGKIAHPTIVPVAHREVRLGETKEMNNGLLAEIVKYDGYADIDVKFLLDGAIVHNTSYKLFKQGSIAHPMIHSIFTLSIQEFAVGYYLKQLGFRKVKKGEWKDRGFGMMELDFYNEEHHLAIEVDGSVHNKDGGFERDLHKNSKCKEFGIKLYRLRDQALKHLNDDNSINYILYRKNRIDGNLMIDCSMELVSILKANNINLPDDDFIDFKRDFNKIMSEYKELVLNPRKDVHVGERVYFESAKQYATLTVFRSSMSVDIVFDDGCEKLGVTYANFKKGSVRHPNVSGSDIAKELVAKGQNPISSLGKKKRDKLAKELIGKEYKLKNGSIVKIIEYNNANNITIMFEDGAVKSSVSHRALKGGYVKHPSESC